MSQPQKSRCKQAEQRAQGEPLCRAVHEHRVLARNTAWDGECWTSAFITRASLHLKEKYFFPRKPRTENQWAEKLRTGGLSTLEQSQGKCGNVFSQWDFGFPEVACHSIKSL